MENELVTDSFSEYRGGGIHGRPSRFSYAEKFEKLCPQYMAMGLSYEDYWYGDPKKAYYVREAYLYKLEEENRAMWMMGRYVYEAIFDNAPVLRAFSSATSPSRYLQEPLPATERMAKEQEEKRIKEERQRVRDEMEAQIAAANKKIRERKISDGRAPGP